MCYFAGPIKLVCREWLPLGIFLQKLLILSFAPHEKPYTVMAIIPCRINFKYSTDLAKV